MTKTHSSKRWAWYETATKPGMKLAKLDVIPHNNTNRKIRQKSML